MSYRVDLVQQVAERLSGAVGLSEVSDVMASIAQDGMGACSVVVSVLDRDGRAFTVPVAEGVSSQAEERLSGRVPIDAWPAAQQALSDGRALLWGTLDDRDREFPELATLGAKARSWAVLPLVAQGTPMGVLSIGWPEERTFGEVEVAFLQVIAHQCAVAADRARIDATRRAEREVLELLSDGSRLIMSALEPEDVLDSLVALAVPRLAPWCAVYVADQGMLRRVAIAIDEEEELSAQLRGEVAMSADDDAPAAVAFRSGQQQVVRIEEATIRRLYPAIVADRVLRRGGTWGGVAVRVQSGGEPIGALTLLSPTWATGPPEQVQFAVEGLASRAGVALVNARRFDLERRTATMLMEAFLPAEIPGIPGYEVAARYLPAGARVAGDWYDVVTLPSGEVLVGIGDSGGHGTPAASLMGQLRNCARGLAMTGHSPGAVLGALRVVTGANGRDSFATALYATLDPVGHSVRWSSAGHLPPLRFGFGSAEYLDGPKSPPLGTPAPAPPERLDRWDPGQGIVLVTDGVVERRRHSLDEGMAALQDLVAQHEGSAAELTERITEELCGGAEDDCCVLVLRRAQA